MNHNVKEAKEKAFKTVERHAAEKINCLIILSPSLLRRAPSLLK
jgi:hypothetical protein